MKKFIFAALLAAAILPGCRTSGADPVVKRYLKDSLEVFSARCQQTLDAAYMVDSLIEIKEDIPGWEGFPVKLYQYYTGEDIYLKAPKRALVYLLNPSAEKLATWIVNAVFDATGALEYENLEKVRQFITWQSGAQFPVKGVVFEDMYTKGFHEPYVFKDGVTVYIADSTYLSPTKTPTDEMLDYYINLAEDNSQLKPNTGRYARICSTTREMYYNAGGTADVGYSDDGQRSQAWLSEVARLYKEAWNSDKNFLIYAWAKSNL
ncbi:MAG: cellulase [Bacteroidales bacterium]|nr:cellulase [Candidatus Cacconaster merdequi]